MAMYRTRKSAASAFYSVKGGGDANLVEFLPPDFPVVEIDDPGNDLTWVHVRKFFNNVAGGEGWIARADLEVAKPPSLSQDIDLDAFVTAAIDTELYFNVRDDIAPFYADADYLLALANIESGTKNLSGQGPLADRFGPFCLSQAEWAAFLASGFADASFTEFDSIWPSAQVDCAAYQMHDLAAALSSLQAQAGVGDAGNPYLPRHGELLRARMIGTQLSFKMQRMLKDDQGNMLISDFLSANGLSEQEIAALLKYRIGFMRNGGTEDGDPLTLKGFSDKCAEVLNAELKTAFDRIKTYRPDAIETPATSSAPWMDKARLEMNAGISENTPEGRQRIAQYFTSTGTNGTASTPWCGAFVAWCLDQGGGAIKQSVDPIRPRAAAAAAWRNWGDMEINLKDAPPVGAVVLIAASKETNDISHVGFFKSYDDGARAVTLLGGNQSNKVCEVPFKAADVVSIRWKNDLPRQQAVTVAGGNPIPAGREAMARIVVNEFAAAGYGTMHQIVALANAIAESGLDPKKPGDGGISIGLFQCNMKKGAGVGHKKSDLEEPTYNTRVIIAVANRHGDFAKATTIDTAVDIFVRKVEITKDQPGDIVKRRKIAKQLSASLIAG
jgi:uncharacterized protein (TIGR02594 family)